MKKVLIVLSFWLLFLSGSFSAEDFTVEKLGKILYQINNPTSAQLWYNTKKEAIWYFCINMQAYSDNILDATTFDPSKSIFLRLLCKESWLYDWQFASDIQLNPTFTKQLQGISKGKLKWIFTNCKIQGYNLVKDSLNDINFACVSKKIFDAIASDITNLMSAKAYGYSKW